MLFDNLLSVAQSDAQRFDLMPWLAIAVSVVGVCISMWRNRYDVNADNEKRIREMITQNTSRIESIEDTLERKVEKLDNASDKLYDVVNNLSQQLTRLSTQVEFLIRQIGKS
jgi:vacuolar-type H+-ATPase subunit I/STV1